MKAQNSMPTQTHLEQTVNYFKNKAAEYDLVDDQPYWVLSDRLLEDFLIRFAGQLPNDFHFLDAGGGTGRWTMHLAGKFPGSSGHIFDLSADMLAQAKAKISKQKLTKRITVSQGDLHQLPADLQAGTFDLAFNFHNVLGFVEKPQVVIKNLTQAVKKNGYVISLVPNLYHAMFFNLSLGNVNEAKNIFQSKKGRFTKEMPAIHFFSPESITDIYQQAGLDVMQITGFPTILYPGYQETQLKGSTNSLQDLLSDSVNFDQIFALEKELMSRSDIAARGNNILIVGQKKK